MTTVDEVRAAAEAVPDPELPPVTLGMLGVVHDVTVDGARATVDLLPTFAGCPALDAMSDDVRVAVLAVPGISEVDVRHRFDPPWTSDRISPAGRDALRSFGIAPPDDRRRLPLVEVARPCPYCGSTDTERDGLFGPTPCRDVRYCRACSQPFEAFKSLG